eukprot:COSAG05_NODE_2468_length_3027_cov_1.333675_1_plen_48_part_10
MQQVGSLTATQRQEYRTRGFVAIPGLLDETTVRSLRGEYDRELASGSS